MDKGGSCHTPGEAYAGSNPVFPFLFAWIAQLAERRSCKADVGGSIPPPGSITFKQSGVAQLVRAHGSYPCCHRFESGRRYQSHKQAGIFNCG